MTLDRQSPPRFVRLWLGVVVLIVAACSVSSVPTAGSTATASAMPSTASATPPRVTASPSAASTPAPSGPSSSASALPSLRAATGIVFDSTASTYRVTGTTARALVAAMRAKALRDDAGDSAFALTSWFVSWSYDYDKGADSCAIDGLDVRLKITVLLPRWDAPPGTDAELVARWGRYIDALRLHERGHELNGLDRAEEVRDDLLELGSRSSCAALERAADAAGDLVIEAGQAWDRTYDDTTDHGATQGAVFP